MPTDQTIDPDATFEDVPEGHPVLKALRSERATVKELKGQVQFFSTVAKFPNLGLTPDDFKGLTPDEYEARAQRLASLAGPRETAISGTQPDVEPTPPAPAVPSPAEAAFTRMQNLTAGGAPVAEDKQITRKELEALRTSGKISLAEAREMIKSGRVRFDHVQVPSPPW